jgi:hypothetical protein
VRAPVNAGAGNQLESSSCIPAREAKTGRARNLLYRFPGIGSTTTRRWGDIMRRFLGQFIVVFGILLMVLGAGQLLLAEVLSTDPRPNLVGNGMLFVLAWYGGITVIGLGLVVGRFKASRYV